MRELMRSNDWVRLSFTQSLLSEAGIATIILDQHTSVLEGSIGAIQRRVMIDEDDHEAAVRLIAEWDL